MTNTKTLALDFMACFNGKDVDAAMDWFAQDAIYTDPEGKLYRGGEEIRAALSVIFDGTLGQIHYKVTDMIVDEAASKALVTWTLEMTAEDGGVTMMRALDILQFENEKVRSKDCYSRASALLIESC